LSDFADVSLPATGGGTGALNGVDEAGAKDLSSVTADAELLTGCTASVSCKHYHCH